MTPAATYAACLLDMRANLIELTRQIEFANNLDFVPANSAKLDATMGKIRMFSRLIDGTAVDCQFEIGEIS